MKRSRRRRKKYYGKGLIRPTLNSSRLFVGEGLLKKRYKKKRRVYGRGIFGPLFSVVPKLLDKIL